MNVNFESELAKEMFRHDIGKYLFLNFHYYFISVGAKIG
jgi:hypothetical protein